MKGHSLSTGAPGHRLSVFLFLNFYRDFQVKILYGISYTTFQNPLYRDFPVKFIPAVFGPPGLGWPPGGPSGCSACARGDARYLVPGNTPNSSHIRYVYSCCIKIYAVVYTRLPSATAHATAAAPTGSTHARTDRQLARSTAKYLVLDSQRKF